MDRVIFFPVRVAKRMEELVNLLKKWKQERYCFNSSSVPLEIYDQHYEELLKLEKQYDYVFPDSPTRVVGYKPTGVLPLSHRQIPMLSLDSVDSYEKLWEWEKRLRKILKIDLDIEYVCEWKIDGLSVSLIYRNSQLTEISTRGDGYVGENVTANYSLVSDLPLQLNFASDCEVRGEIYMKKDEFQRINQELEIRGQRKLSNPRNAASGSLRTLSSSSRILHFFAYRLLNKCSTQVECLRKLQNLGFATSEYQLCRNLIEVVQFVRQKEQNFRELNFEVDGIVIKVNKYEYCDSLGQTSKYPRWAVAYKFMSTVGYSEIKNIETEVSRNGRITYVAQITPLFLSGSTIKKVSLHNYSFIKKLQLDIGDKIVIKKSGSVIPQIVQVIRLEKDKNQSWRPPVNCPACNSLLSWNSHQFCTNKNCERQSVNLLIHFVSKAGLNIKGVSYKMVEKLYTKKLLRKPTDFYCLHLFRDQLLGLEGIGEKRISSILNKIEESRRKPFSTLLSALSIPLLSSVKAFKIASVYPSLDKFITVLGDNKWEEIQKVIGKKTQEELRKYWEVENNKNLLLELSKIFPDLEKK